MWLSGLSGGKSPHKKRPHSLKNSGADGEECESILRRENRRKYLNNVVEQDHRFVKRRVNPGLGFGSFHTAQRTLQGYEAMHMLRKGQLKGLAKGDVLAQNRVIAQVFGLVV